MTEKEVEEYIKKLDEALAESERIMLEEKAARGEDVVNGDGKGNVVRIPAAQVLASHVAHK